MAIKVIIFLLNKNFKCNILNIVGEDMKNIFKLLILIVISLFLYIDVDAQTKECTYELGYNNGSTTLKDQITFYLEPGVGIKDEFYMKSTNTKTKFGGAMAIPKGKIYTDKPFYIGDKQEILNAFYDSNNKVVSSCPSSLPFIVFGTGTAIFEDGYILCNGNYHSGPEGVIIQGTITQVKSDTDTDEDKNNQRKNCGKSFVFSLNSTNDASEYKGYSLIGQYYLENNTKYIEIKLKKGQEERDSTTHALVPTVGSTLEIDYFQKKYGGLPLKVETFDNCDNMPPTKTCEVLDSTTKLFIGSDCTNDANGDPDTEKNTETGEEYENKYENNYGPFEGNMPAPGFGENGDLCSDILNENLSKLVKLCITILRIAGAVIAVVNGMIALIPAVVSKNPDALKKAGHKCMLMGVILLVIGVFPTLLRVIAKIFGYDVSCIF